MLVNPLRPTLTPPSNPSMTNGGLAERSRDDANRREVAPPTSTVSAPAASAAAVRRPTDLRSKQVVTLADPASTATAGASSKCEDAPSNMFRITNARPSVMLLRANAPARTCRIRAMNNNPTRSDKEREHDRGHGTFGAVASQHEEHEAPHAHAQNGRNRRLKSGKDLSRVWSRMAAAPSTTPTPALLRLAFGGDPPNLGDEGDHCSLVEPERLEHPGLEPTHRINRESR